MRGLATVGEDPCRAGDRVVANPAPNGGVAVGGQRDGVALLGGSSRAGADQLVSQLAPNIVAAGEDPRRPGIRVIAIPAHDGSVAVVGRVWRPRGDWFQANSESQEGSFRSGRRPGNRTNLPGAQAKGVAANRKNADAFPSRCALAPSAVLRRLAAERIMLSPCRRISRYLDRGPRQY